MNKILSFDKPQQVQSTKDWRANNSADGAPPGCYTPNMSDEDKLKWKAKHINKGKPDARVEIRKTFSVNRNYAQMLAIVTKDGVVMSANGKMDISLQEVTELHQAFIEAYNLLGIELN